MSGHTSVLSLGSIIDAPIRRHYNSIRPHPEAATASPVDTLVHLAGISHPSSLKTWRSRGIDPTSIRLARWPYLLAPPKRCGDAGTSTPSGSGDAGSDGRRIGGGARKSRSGVGLSKCWRSGAEAIDIFTAGQHWPPLLLAGVRLLLLWPTFPIPPYIQRANQPSQDRVRWFSSVRVELSLILFGLSRCHLKMMESVSKCLVRYHHLRKPALPAIHAIASQTHDVDQGHVHRKGVRTSVCFFHQSDRKRTLVLQRQVW